MFTFKKITMLLVAALLVVPAIATAQSKGGGKPTGTTTVPVGGELSADSLAQRYLALAGSAENAQSLVNGVRSGTEVVLKRIVEVNVQKTCTRVTGQEQYQEPIYFPGTTFVIGYTTKVRDITETYDCSTVNTDLQSVSFTPGTGNMGWGNVDVALGFAQAQLTEAGVNSPAPADVKAALMGGQVTGQNATMTLPGILTLRASGLGWGQIADKLGYKLQ
jgi:hypothetical protein